jgi:hypothetical protein
MARACSGVQFSSRDNPLTRDDADAGAVVRRGDRALRPRRDTDPLRRRDPDRDPDAFVGEEDGEREGEGEEGLVGVVGAGLTDEESRPSTHTRASAAPATSE